MPQVTRSVARNLYRTTASQLPQGRDAQLSLQMLWPYIQKYAEKYGVDPRVLAGIIAQESGFKNYGVHRDGTGHGLIGLDDNGLLPSFERWSGQHFGRGASARTIPPELQVEFLAKTIAEYKQRHGSEFAAARAWHRGEGAMNDWRGRHYEQLIKGHIERLFRGGVPSTDGAEVPDSALPGASNLPEPDWPKPSPGGSYVIQHGDTLWDIASRLKARGVQGSHWDIINQIVAMNPQIKNPNLIYAGDTLNLPAAIDGATSSFQPSVLRPPVEINPGSPVDAVNASGPVDGSRVPYISQYRPSGAERGYYNGPSNCGPTSMAMLARAFGYGQGMTDAQLINHLGQIGGTTANGTNVNGIIAMARAMGKSAEMRAGAHIEWMVEALKNGKMVIANGDYYEMPPHRNPGATSGHYVAVVGIDGNGNFIVRDPADQNVRLVSQADMARFITSNPNGGFTFVVG